MSGPPRDRGALSLVLHSHMPYVEGFGTWPFGEEWLWEALATVYLPLLGVIDGAPVTLGVTPVLADQLETLTGDAGDRFRGFCGPLRARVHEEAAAELDAAHDHGAGRAVRAAAKDYERALAIFDGLGGDLLGAVARLERVERMTSSATHAVLPLVATEAGLELQLAGGIAAHERRFGGHGGAFWLPECAYEPGLEHALAAHGAEVFCVDQTDAWGLGAPEQLEPVLTGSGAVAVPIDWQLVGLVWDPGAYPGHPVYRDTWRRGPHDRLAWRTDHRPYERAAGEAQARRHAEDFVARAIDRLDRHRDERGRAGVVCAALDTELLGHWWYEGLAWLEAVLAEAERRGLRLATLSEAVAEVEPVAGRALTASSWGRPKDLSSWDSPKVAGLCWAARRRELALVAAAARPRAAARHPHALARAARELLALQASDWAFLVTRELAGPYAQERADGHAAALDAALAALTDSAPEPEPHVRNLVPELDVAPLLTP